MPPVLGHAHGRLLDAKGNPLAEVKVHLKYPPTLDSGMSPPDQEVATDRDGRFRVEGLLPDLDHELTLEHATKKGVTFSAGNALNKLKTRSGEIKDLGDITVKGTSS